jgi:phosphoenolpyruvate mutase
MSIKKVYVGFSADLIHHGHINIIDEASKYGEVTIGLLSDEAIKSYKRSPIINYESRKKVVESFKNVKNVIVQNTLDYTQNLELIKPDYVVHGDDWKSGVQKETRNNILELIKKWNGQLIDVPYTPNISTTSIINKIIDENRDSNYICNSKKLRDLINSKSLEFIMEAHNGISAKIVEESGFKAIWASGLCLAGSLGLRDDNEASWSQVTDMLEYMVKSVKIPILVDGASGYGNFNNARIFCRKLEQLGIGGVCFEDKLFPKTNSFIEVQGGQQLADINEFCGKIKACKDYQINPNFVIVARLEAFISGQGLDEALKRAYAYHNAGADAILVHSKINTSKDIDDFMNKWDNRCPIIIVPTKYYSTPTQHFRDINISTIIWANHNFRAAINIMKETSKQIFNDESLVNVEKNIASVNDIFNYTGEEQLKNDEKIYLNIV